MQYIEAFEWEASWIIHGVLKRRLTVPVKIQKVAYKQVDLCYVLHRDKEIKLVPLETYILSTYVW